MESTCREKGKVSIDKSFFCEKQSLFCPFCNFKFVTLGGMTSHIKSAHGTKEPHEKANIASESSIEKTDEIASTIAEENSIPQPKVPEKSAIELEHEKIFDMKAQVFITLHEWEPALEAAKSAIKIEPKWWSAYQTLGRAYLGYGQLQQAVFVSFLKINIRFI